MRQTPLYAKIVLYTVGVFGIVIFLFFAVVKADFYTTEKRAQSACKLFEKGMTPKAYLSRLSKSGIKTDGIYVAKANDLILIWFRPKTVPEKFDCAITVENGRLTSAEIEQFD